MPKSKAPPFSLAKIRKKLSEVSPSFCLAKWQQVTLHLQNGNTHSCHHPRSHPVPLRELSKNPDALHNTRHKMLARQEMLEGKRPQECNYCWTVEDLSPDLVSDRFRKSAADWAIHDFDRVRQLPWDAHVIPSYLEVSFSNTCNFKCAYCAPHISSKWMEEVREQGDYPVSSEFCTLGYLKETKLLPIPEGEPNPYVDAFWKWWPELYPKLKVLRITGGEPLLTRHTFRVLDEVKENPRPDLELAVNSNLGTPRKIIDRFIGKVKEFEHGKHVKSFTLFTSLDTWGKQAEYIRFGMDFEQYWKNVRLVLTELPDIRLIFMCTVNVMSPPGLLRLLEGVYELKQEFGLGKDDGSPRVMIDFPFLNRPGFLSPRLLPAEFARYVERALDYVGERMGAEGFADAERDPLKRLLELMKAAPNPAWQMRFRVEFVNFITEYDRRREVSFEKTFPELQQFIQLCRHEGRYE